MTYQIILIAALSIGVLPCWSQQHHTEFGAQDSAGRSWKTALNHTADQSPCETFRNLQAKNLSQLITVSTGLWHLADPDEGGQVSWGIMNTSDYHKLKNKHTMMLESPAGAVLALQYQCDDHDGISAKLMVI